MKTTVAAPAPEPLMQEVADLLGAWLWMRVMSELTAESERVERRRQRKAWWERERRQRRW